MNLLKLKDNQPVPAGAVPRREDQDRIDAADSVAALCRKIQDRINAADCVLVDLMEASDQTAAERPQIFQYRKSKEGSFALWTGNYVGQFEFHDKDGTIDRVVIGARGLGFQKSKDRQDQQGRFLLEAMLETCWDLPLLFVEEEVEGELWDHYDVLLAVRLAAQLDRAYRKGTLRVYRSVQRRDSRVQGRLDIPREIRRGMGLQDGRIAYEVREYTEDNDYNRLFFLACREAERQYPALMLHIRKRLPGYGIAYRTLQSAFWGRLDANALLDRTQKKITNPIYRDYEMLRGLSRAFLRRRGYYSQPGGSGAPFVTGVFLDLSVLWERYLLKKVLEKLPGAWEGPCYQKEEVRILNDNMVVRPDFLWPKDHVVLDAKYRPEWGKTLKAPKGVKGDWTYLQDDVYQVLTYMLELECPQGGVLFPVDRALLPADGALQEQQEFKIPIKSISGTFWRFPFGVPDEISDYSAFCRAMDREAQRARREVAKLFGAARS